MGLNSYNFYKIIILLFVLTNLIHAEKVGSLFDVTATNKEIRIQSNLMTYYFVNIVSPDGKYVSSPILVDRNDKKMKIDYGKLKVKWEGLIPDLSYSAPNNEIFEFEKKLTKIENPSNFYTDWKNSKLEFQGGNLKNFWDESFEKDKTKAIGLFILNLSVIPQLAADSVSSDLKISKQIKGNVNKFLNLTKKLTQYQENINEINFYYTIVDSMINVLKTTIDVYTEEGTAVPSKISEAYAYWQYIKKLTDNALGAFNVLNIDRKLQVEIRGYTKKEVAMVAKDFDKAIQNRIDATDATIESSIKVLVSSTPGVTGDEDKLTKIADSILAGIQRGLVVYEKKILDKIKDEALKKKKANRIRIAKISIASLAFANKIISIDSIKEKDSFLLKFLSDVGGEVWGLVVSTYVDDPMKFINKYSNKVSGELFSKGKKAIATLGRGVQIGHTVGNKLIPFLYDWSFEKNIVSTDISDGKVGLYGALDTKIIIENKEGKTIWNSSTDSDFLYRKLNDKITVKVYAKQNNVFDSERSPWEINKYIPPQPLLDAYTSYNGQKKRLRMCITKIYYPDPENYYNFYANSGIFLGKTLFSKETLTGESAGNISNWKCDKDSSFLSQTINRYSLEDFNTNYVDYLSAYKLKSLDKPLMTSVIEVNDFSKNLVINLGGYNEARVDTVISLKETPVIDTSFNYQDKIIQLNNIDVLNINGDSPIKYHWTFPHGKIYTTTESFIDTSLYRNGDIVELRIEMQSGANIHINLTIVYPERPAQPTNFKAVRDGQKIKLTWNNVSNAVNYKVYYTEDIDSSDVPSTLPINQPKYCIIRKKANKNEKPKI